MSLWGNGGREEGGDLVYSRKVSDLDFVYLKGHSFKAFSLNSRKKILETLENDLYTESAKTLTIFF
jgi:hypothetical protein